jgi:hypothetical protein
MGRCKGGVGQRRGLRLALTLRAGDRCVRARSCTMYRLPLGRTVHPRLPPPGPPPLASRLTPQWLHTAHKLLRALVAERNPWQAQESRKHFPLNPSLPSLSLRWPVGSRSRRKWSMKATWHKHLRHHRHKLRHWSASGEAHNARWVGIQCRVQASLKRCLEQGLGITTAE